MSKPPLIKTKRVYDSPAKSDGQRVLVDRLWPRGLKKEDVRIDVWAKQIAPSTELRQWFGHEPSRFAEFRLRYLEELREQADAAARLLEEADAETMTLLYAARDRAHNHAIVLQEFLSQGNSLNS